MSGLGNAIPGTTPRAQIDVRTLIPGFPLRAKAAQPVKVKTRVKNLSARPFRAQASYGRRLVRLGAQLMAEDGTMLNRDYARAWLPGDIPPGGTADIEIEVPAPDAARPLRAEVRPGQRRHRLVREVRLADNDETARRALAGAWHDRPKFSAVSANMAETPSFRAVSCQAPTRYGSSDAV